MEQILQQEDFLYCLGPSCAQENCQRLFRNENLNQDQFSLHKLVPISCKNEIWIERIMEGTDVRTDEIFKEVDFDKEIHNYFEDMIKDIHQILENAKKMLSISQNNQNFMKQKIMALISQFKTDLFSFQQTEARDLNKEYTKHKNQLVQDIQEINQESQMIEKKKIIVEEQMLILKQLLSHSKLTYSINSAILANECDGNFQIKGLTISQGHILKQTYCCFINCPIDKKYYQCPLKIRITHSPKQMHWFAVGLYYKKKGKNFPNQIDVKNQNYYVMTSNMYLIKGGVKEEFFPSMKEFDNETTIIITIFDHIIQFQQQQENGEYISSNIEFENPILTPLYVCLLSNQKEENRKTSFIFL